MAATSEQQNVQIENRTVQDANIQAGDEVGAVVGTYGSYAYDIKPIENCVMFGGSIAGNSCFSDVAGLNTGDITSCAAFGLAIRATDGVGGIAGDGSVSNCYVSDITALSGTPNATQGKVAKLKLGDELLKLCDANGKVTATFSWADDAGFTFGNTTWKMPTQADWTSANVFTNLTPGTAYTLYARYAGTDLQSAAQGSLAVKTLAPSDNEDDKDDTEDQEDTAVTVVGRTIRTTGSVQTGDPSMLMLWLVIALIGAVGIVGVIVIIKRKK